MVFFYLTKVAGDGDLKEVLINEAHIESIENRADLQGAAIGLVSGCAVHVQESFESVYSLMRNFGVNIIDPTLRSDDRATRELPKKLRAAQPTPR